MTCKSCFKSWINRRGSTGLQNQRSTPCGPVLTPTSDDREPLTATTRKSAQLRIAPDRRDVVGPSQRGIRMSNSTTWAASAGPGSRVHGNHPTPIHVEAAQSATRRQQEALHSRRLQRPVRAVSPAKKAAAESVRRVFGPAVASPAAIVSLPSLASRPGESAAAGRRRLTMDSFAAQQYSRRAHSPRSAPKLPIEPSPFAARRRHPRFRRRPFALRTCTANPAVFR